MTTYLTATQAATRLGKSEKTIRRWIKEKRLVAHHPQGRPNLLAIAESDIERLAQELAQYEQPEQSESEQAPDIGLLESRITELEQEFNNYRLLNGPDLLALGPGDLTHLENRIDALESRIAALEQQLQRFTSETPAQAAATQPATRILRPKRATYATTERPGTQETPVDIPDGSLLMKDFAERHSVNRNTFRDHIVKGLVPSITRPKQNRPNEFERWLSPEQQRAAIAFWQENGTAYATCDNPVCSCHDFLPDGDTPGLEQEES